MGRALVTGANRGIGLELCRQLAERGEEVIGACRRTSEALDALGIRVEEGVDVTSDEAITALDRRLGDLSLDLVINCAGILERNALESLDYDSIRRQFEVNAVGPLRVSATLLHRMGPGSKIAIVTSRMGSIEDNSSGNSYGYRMSKAAVNMAGKSLAIDLRERGVAVCLLHPGFVKTEMTGHRGDVSPAEAARGLLERIDALTLESSGGFWHARGERLPW
ncbi:MAG: SDR family oxidoreductase [Deltaproteobacteria bacterium]|nr:MAG: SDR family oxidoreductase [Deltaproteobacteria bacterium]